MKHVTSAMFFVLVLMLALAQQRPAHASIINGSVSLDTTGLSDTFEMAFIFIDGSGAGDANNAVTLTNFGFGVGGSAGAVDPRLTTGGVSGDLTTGVTLVDSTFFNVFAATFTAGTLLTFDFGLTTNLEGTPDQFSMALLQSDGTQIATTDPSGADSLLTVNIDSAHPAFSAFASDLTPAPVVTLSASAPEPSSMLLLVAALMVALWSARARPGGARATPGPDRTVSMSGTGMRPMMRS